MSEQQRHHVTVHVQRFIGEQIVLQHGFLRHPERVQYQRTGEAGAVLAGGAVHQEGALLELQQGLEHTGVIFGVFPCQKAIDLHHVFDTPAHGRLALVGQLPQPSGVAGLDGNLQLAHRARKGRRGLPASLVVPAQIADQIHTQLGKGVAGLVRQMSQ